MGDAGFFRGTSSEQDNRFTDKQKKLLKTLKFHPNLAQKADVKKVNLDVLKPWITNRVNDILGLEDDVVIEYIFSQLEEKALDPRLMQINLTGFLNAKRAREFMAELWQMMLDAQETADGIPPQLVEQKKAELKKRMDEQQTVSEPQRTVVDNSSEVPQPKESSGRRAYDRSDSRTREANARARERALERRRSRSRSRSRDRRYRDERAPPRRERSRSPYRPPPPPPSWRRRRSRSRSRSRDRLPAADRSHHAKYEDKTKQSVKDVADAEGQNAKAETKKRDSDRKTKKEKKRKEKEQKKKERKHKEKRKKQKKRRKSETDSSGSYDDSGASDADTASKSKPRDTEHDKLEMVLREKALQSMKKQH